MGTCELCGRFEAEFEDPTFDASKCVKFDAEGNPPRSLKLCHSCAASCIERAMYEVVQ